MDAGGNGGVVGVRPGEISGGPHPGAVPPVHGPEPDGVPQVPEGVPAWVATPDGWERVAAVLRRAPFFGWDTETWGHSVKGADASTPARRSRVHVWSVAVPTRRLHPRGFRVAEARVLPVEALTHPALRDVLEDARVMKVAHNAGHDVHSVANHGVTVRGCVDSLPRARVAWPGTGVTAKQIGRERLGRDLLEFEAVLAWHEDVEVRLVGCVCGVQKCRRRSAGHGRCEVTETRRRPALAPLESVVPGHPLFTTLVRYAGDDALVACEAWDLMDSLPSPNLPNLPWVP
jgi:hypothetical protein